jgi:hypothetical protein
MANPRRIDLWSIPAGLFFLAWGIQPPLIAFKVLAGVLAIFGLVFAAFVGSGRDKVLSAIQAIAALALAGAALLFEVRPLDFGSRATFVLAGIASLAAPLVGIFRRSRKSAEPVVNAKE